MVELELQDVIVAPGAEEVLAVSVRNLREVPTVYGFVVTGLAQGWTSIEPATLALPPGSHAAVRLTFRPPRNWSVTSGPTPFSLRVVPHGAPDDVAVADGTITVLSFDERVVHLAQPVQRGRRRGEFHVLVENFGNGHASCRLVLNDPTRRLKGKFSPPSVGVQPGMSQPSRLTVTARRRWRRSRSLPFGVQVVQDGRPTVETSGTFLQDSMFSARSLGRVLGVAALAGGVAGAWFGLVKPEIRREVERSGQRAPVTTIAEAPTYTPVSVPDPGTASTVAAPPENTAAPGAGQQPYANRLEAVADLAQQGTAAYTVEAGQTLRVSDVLLQNPDRDGGRLALLHNDQLLYEAALENITDYPIPMRGDFVFGPGETVTLQVTCTAVGDPTGTACRVAATLVGTLEPTN